MRDQLIAALEGQPGLCPKCVAQRLGVSMREALMAIRDALYAGVGLRVVFDRCPECKGASAFVAMQQRAG